MISIMKMYLPYGPVLAQDNNLKKHLPRYFSAKTYRLLDAWIHPWKGRYSCEKPLKIYKIIPFRESTRNCVLSTVLQKVVHRQGGKNINRNQEAAPSHSTLRCRVRRSKLSITKRVGSIYTTFIQYLKWRSVLARTMWPYVLLLKV